MNTKKLMTSLFCLLAALQGFCRPDILKVRPQIYYRTVNVAGLKIFYREAGPKDGPVILLLHGFPSSSRMFESLFPLLDDKFHLIAPDYPGFGYSDAPPAARFAYTFDHLAEVITGFTRTIGLKSYTLYMQDYGGPVGFRLALANPSAIKAMIVQNAGVYNDALSPLWNTRKAFWKDRAKYEEQLRQNFSSLEATKQRHVGTNPHPETLNLDTWMDEYAFLSRPGEAQIQLDLFYNYQRNIAAYPKWQAWLRRYKPRLLVLWGKYDPSFIVPGAEAFRRDVPDCQVRILSAGHFALDEDAEEMAGYVRKFLTTVPN